MRAGRHCITNERAVPAGLTAAERNDRRAERWKQRTEVLRINTESVIDDDEGRLPERRPVTLGQVGSLSTPVQELTETKRGHASVLDQIRGCHDPVHDLIEIPYVDAEDGVQGFLDTAFDVTG